MKTIRLLPCVCIPLIGASAWAADIKGRITDADGEPLPGTAIQLVALPDTVRKGYQMAGDNGSFSLKDIKPGKYLLLEIGRAHV